MAIYLGSNQVGVTGLESNTSDATATHSDILSGKTAYANGSKVTGTISSKTSEEYVPTTSDQTISAGQYLSGDQIVKGDSDLIASNIKNGVTIFGVTGNLTSITPLVNNLTFSGTYATATYYTAAYCGAFYAANGRVAVILKGGSDTSYENLYFTLTDNSGQGITLAGQSVYNYASATAGNYYVAILNNVSSSINISIAMNARNSTSDYVTCAMTITNA